MNPIAYGGYPLMFYIVPILMCAILLVGLVRTLKEWNHNEHSPRLTVPAKVVAKRTAFRRRMSNKVNLHSGANTNYYATFQFESGDRMELELRGQEYGMLVEGDNGRLTFQGSRYLGFERT